MNVCVCVSVEINFYSFDTWMPLLHCISHWLDVGINYIHYTNAIIYSIQKKTQCISYSFSTQSVGRSVCITFWLKYNSDGFFLLCCLHPHAFRVPIVYSNPTDNFLFGRRSQIGYNPLDVQAIFFHRYHTLSLLCCFCSFSWHFFSF